MTNASNPRAVDYLIVGQGLAGTLLAYELLKRRKTALVVDAQKPHTASRVAAGMYNPVSGKRMVKGAHTDEKLEHALHLYREIESEFGISVVHESALLNIAGSIKEQNDLAAKLDYPGFASHIDLHPEPVKNIRQPFGAFGIRGAGWVDIKLLLDKMKERLLKNDQLLIESFNHALLKNSADHWVYKDTQYGQVVFCEGADGMLNPFFPNLPFQLCKGDMLTIRCEGLDANRIIKKGIYLIPLGNEIYKVGSTYEWNDLSESPTAHGKKMLMNKLNELLELPYTVLSHEAAIRPTTRTREPILLQHPQWKTMWLLNGLGTKGVINGPWLVRELLLQLT